MASTYLQKVPSSVGSTTTATFSFWVKIGGTATQAIYTVHDGSAQFDIFVRNSIGLVDFYGYNGSSFDFRLHTSRKLRDHNAWYHIVCKVDLTNSTQTDRAILYINGVRETAFSIETYPSNASATAIFSKNSTTTIGATHTGGSDFDGVLSHFHFCDGYAYDASTFGSTDATTGEWKINTNPNVQYGTNGFFLFKDNASTTDQSGQGNNWSVTAGTLTKTEDCPNNVFATWNKNLAMNSTMSLANGNTSATTASNYSNGASNVWFSTLGMSSGKFYCEMKLSAASANQGEMVGVGYDLSKFQQGGTVSAYNIGYISEGWSYMGAEGKIKNNNSDVLTGMPTWGTNDIVCMAIDLDNYKLYFRKNGDAWINSGNPESGATGTGAVSLTSGKTYFFACSDASSGNTYTYQANFGNGFFGTTAVSSAGTNASNNGIFEYDVPAGYTALSTKGLNL